MKKFLIIVLLLGSFLSYSIGLVHLVKPHSTHQNVSSLHACSTFKSIYFSVSCNPALFPYQEEMGLALHVVGKAEGGSIENGKKLIFENLTKENIESLFENQNYNSFNLNSTILFKTPLFHLSYSPYFILADILVFNPAFPEISLYLINKKSLNLTTGFDLMPLFGGSKDINFAVGANAYYQEIDFYQDTFTLSQLALSNPEDIIVFDTTYNLSADIGLYLDFESFHYLPSFSMQVKNLNSQYDLVDSRLTSATTLQPFLLMETYSQFGIGKQIKSSIGQFDIGVENYFNGFYSEFYKDYMSMSLNYTLGQASLSLAGSKYHKVVGMHFKSEITKIGIMYANEKDLGELHQEKDDDTVYLSFEVGL